MVFYRYFTPFHASVDSNVYEQSKIVGLCLAMIPSWYFNIRTQCTCECEFFVYGGFRGNENSFVSKKRHVNWLVTLIGWRLATKTVMTTANMVTGITEMIIGPREMVSGTIEMMLGTIKMILGTMEMIIGTMKLVSGTMEIIIGTMKMVSETMEIVSGTMEMIM